MPESSAAPDDDISGQSFVAPDGIRLRWWKDDDLAVAYDGTLGRTHLISALASTVIGMASQQPVGVLALRRLLGCTAEGDDDAADSASAALVEETVSGLVGAGLLIRQS